MAIADIKQAKELNKQGARLGRSGLSARVLYLVEEFIKDPTYKKAMQLAGRLRAISIAAKFDEYWTEQVNNGFQLECHELRNFKDPLEDVPKEDQF